MTSINTQTPRSSPFSSPLYGSFSNSPSGERVPAATRSEPAVETPALRTNAEPLASASESAARSAPVHDDSTDWLSSAVNGAKAALEQLGEQLELFSRVAYLRGQNGLGAINRAWSNSVGESAGRLGAFGLGMSLAKDVGQHGVVEGGLRTGVKEVGSNAGAALGVLLSPSLPLKLASAAVGAVVGENLTDAALDEISAGYWAADTLYDETLAAGGGLNDAARANLAQHQGWLTDPSLSPLQRAGQFAVDGLQTFGGDLAVLWDGASDWLSGDEAVPSFTPAFEAPTFEWSEPDVTGGWSDFDDGAYAWSEFDDISSGASTIAQSF